MLTTTGRRNSRPGSDRVSRCAAGLTENLFMDNREDCAFLLSHVGRKAIIVLHMEGIVEFVEDLATYITNDNKYFF